MSIALKKECNFYRNIVESAAKGKGSAADISRPVHETLRHTGHGSPFGASWGSPACLRPLSPTDNSGSLRGINESKKFFNILPISNNLTGRTLDSGLRKKKSSAEQYVRERKSNASKQFAYNKLKAEKHQTSSVLSKSKPSRPPQPKISNAEAEKEGMLIDLSPTTSGDHNLSTTLSSSGQQAMSQTASSLNVSLLDAPIDVPTEGASFSFTNGSECETKLEPPPYQSPPTYMNTLGMCQSMDNYAASTSFSNVQAPSSNSNHQSDPFNTSHITPRYGSTVIERPHPSQHSPSKYTELGAIAKQLQQQQQKPMTNQLDALVLNTMASLSPRSSYKNLSTLVSVDAKSNNTNNLWNRAPSNISPRLEDLTIPQGAGSPGDQEDDEENSLSESMKVNLSTLSIDDSINNSRSSAKKLDKAFYADLEKEIYKNESSAAALIVNTSQTYARQSANKENSVSTMPSEIYERRSIVSGGATGGDSGAINLNKVQNASPRPVKYANAMPKSINQEIAQRSSNYETSPGINLMQQQAVNGSAVAVAAASLKNFAQVPYQIQKQNNTESSAVGTVTIDTASVINQIWFEQQSSTAVAKESPRKPTIGQYGLLPLAAAPEKNHNFVAISNRPLSMVQNDTRPNNIYSSVAGDIYGSIAGDIYETIQPPPAMHQSLTASTPEIFSSIPRNSAVYGNTMPSMAPVLYDEVASEEQLRPHRPAPVVPGLSSQQIQRRMERERQQMQQQQQVYGNVAEVQQMLYGNIPESQKVAALMHEIGDEATQGEAVQALQTANWDHATAVRHFKIERLVR